MKNCPRSEVAFVQEQGDSYGVWGWTFLCRNCREAIFVSNPEMDEAAKQRKLLWFSEQKRKSYFS